MNTKKLLCATLIFFSFFVARLNAQNVANSLPLNQNWKYKIGDDNSWKEETIADDDWTTFSFPGKIDLPRRSYIWFRKTCTVPTEIPTNDLWFGTGSSNIGYEIFINGIYIGRHGDMPPKFNARTQLYSAVVIPENLLKSGTFTVAIRAYVSADLINAQGFSLCNGRGAETMNYTRNVFNLRLYIMVALLCVFMGFYFLIQYLFRKEIVYNLWFALSSIFVAGYFYDMGAEKVFMEVEFQRALMRAFLSVSMSCLFLFFLSRYKSKYYKKARNIVLTYSALVTIVDICMVGHERFIDLFFTLNLLPLFVIIVWSLIIIVKAIKRKERDTLSLLFGFIIGIIFAFHDIIYQAMGQIPFAWLQGISFFSFNISVFISLSTQTIRMQKELDASTASIQKQRDSLSNIISQAEQIAEENLLIAKELDNAVEKMATDTSELQDRANTIGSLVEKQTTEITSAKNAVSGLSDSLKTVSSELQAETESVNKTADDTGLLISGFTDVSLGINGAVKFSEELSSLISQGLQNMNLLAKIMENVKDSSTEIMGVVNIVSTFAEQTNLLAMNASIEAAHSGVVGKGFAVIAQEIKKLASASAQQSDKIKDSVTSIEESIKQGFDLSLDVKQFLSKIDEESDSSTARIRAAEEGVLQQQSAGESIVQETQQLTTSSMKIKDEATRQYEYSNEVNTTMYELEKAASEVRNAATEIIEKNTITAQQALNLRNLASRSREATEKLRKIISL